MSKLDELSYDIEQLYIDGESPAAIAEQLNVPVQMVLDWLETIGCQPEPDVIGWLANQLTAKDPVAETPQEEIYSPYFGA